MSQSSQTQPLPSPYITFDAYSAIVAFVGVITVIVNALNASQASSLPPGSAKVLDGITAFLTAALFIGKAIIAHAHVTASGVVMAASTAADAHVQVANTHIQHTDALVQRTQPPVSQPVFDQHAADVKNQLSSIHDELERVLGTLGALLTEPAQSQAGLEQTSAYPPAGVAIGGTEELAATPPEHPAAV